MSLRSGCWCSHSTITASRQNVSFPFISILMVSFLCLCVLCVFVLILRRVPSFSTEDTETQRHRVILLKCDWCSRYNCVQARYLYPVPSPDLKIAFASRAQSRRLARAWRQVVHDSCPTEHRGPDHSTATDESTALRQRLAFQ